MLVGEYLNAFYLSFSGFVLFAYLYLYAYLYVSPLPRGNTWIPEYPNLCTFIFSIYSCSRRRRRISKRITHN